MLLSSQHAALFVLSLPRCQSPLPKRELVPRKRSFFFADRQAGQTQSGWVLPQRGPWGGTPRGRTWEGVAGVHLRCQIHQSFIYTSIGGGARDLQPQDMVLGAGGHHCLKPAEDEMLQDRWDKVPWAEQNPKGEDGGLYMRLMESQDLMHTLINQAIFKEHHLHL